MDVSTLADWYKAYVLYNKISQFDVETSQRFLIQFCVQSLSLLYSKLTHHWQLEMSLPVAAQIATLVGGTQAATNLGFSIHKALQSIRPYSKYKKWTIRVQQISAVVASHGDVMTPEELESFLRVLEL